MALRTILAENFKRLMAARGDVSLKDVTARDGGSNGTLDRIRREASGTTIDSLEKLSQAFEIEPWQLSFLGSTRRHCRVRPDSA